MYRVLGPLGVGTGIDSASVGTACTASSSTGGGGSTKSYSLGADDDVLSKRSIFVVLVRDRMFDIS